MVSQMMFDASADAAAAWLVHVTMSAVQCRCNVQCCCPFSMFKTQSEAWDDIDWSASYMQCAAMTLGKTSRS